MDANIVGDTLLGTQPLTCWSSPSAQLIGTNCVNSMVGYGAEFVGSYGPFSVQAEYRGMHYDRNASIILWQQAPGGTSVNFSGWYVYATWYLTGESRAAAYQTYPKEYTQASGFGQIKILHPSARVDGVPGKLPPGLMKSISIAAAFLSPISLPGSTIPPIFATSKAAEKRT